MFDEMQSSTNNDGEQALNHALAEIDRALSKLDDIMQNRLQSIMAKSRIGREPYTVES